MPYTLPQAEIFQQADQLSVEVLEPLRACVIGGNAELFRYAIAAEKAIIGLGAYDPVLDADYSFPGLPSGSKIDEDYIKLYGDSVLLR